MANLFGVLGSAGRALGVNTLGLHTAGHNIANVETEGFTRQRQVRAASQPVLDEGHHLGTGVEQIRIERVLDPLLQNQLMRQAGMLGSADTQADAVARIEATLNEQDSAGVTAALTGFYDALGDLASASTPGAPGEREGVRVAARNLIDTLSARDADLRGQRRDANRAIDDAVTEINRLSEQIAGLNGAIASAEIQAPANDLRDQLELALRQLSGLVDVETFPDSSGRTTVVLRNGLPLVEGNQSFALSTLPDATDPFDANTLRVIHPNAGGSDVTAQIGSGRLGGLLRARDTSIPAAIRALDTIAYNLAAGVNALHATGVGLDGTVGNFFAALPGVEDAARDLALDPAVAASPDAIAAGLTSAPSDNRIALALADLRETRSALFLPGDPPGPASGPVRTLIDHASAITTDIGQQARSLSLAREQHERVLQNLENRRDQVSGVSLDEEATRLIELQAAFQANARVVSLVDRLLEDVIGML